jgi:acyl carrier protein
VTGADADQMAQLDEVKARLRALVAATAGVPAEVIEDGSSFDADLAMDSLTFVSLQVEIEKTFDVDCSLDELRAVEPRFDAVARLVARKLEEEAR